MLAGLLPLRSVFTPWKLKRAGPPHTTTSPCKRRTRIGLSPRVCDALAPMAHRDPRRIAFATDVRTEMEASGALPDDEAAASRAIDDEVKCRVRRTGLTHVSRAVSNLVKADLISRHYEGYRVDHHNRGGGRHAVYTLRPATRLALATHPTAAA